MARKKVFRKTTKKGTSVKTTYVPRSNERKKVKNYSYTSKDYRAGRPTGKRSRKHVVTVITTKTFKSAKSASKYRSRQTKPTKRR